MLKCDLKAERSRHFLHLFSFYCVYLKFHFYQSYLPFGYEEYNYVINIRILVEDQLGTSTLAIDEYVEFLYDLELI